MQKMAVPAALEPGFEPGKCRTIVDNSDDMFGCPLKFFTASNVQKTFKTAPLHPENGCFCISEFQNWVREFQRNHRKYRHYVGMSCEASYGMSDSITWGKPQRSHFKCYHQLFLQLCSSESSQIHSRKFKWYDWMYSVFFLRHLPMHHMQQTYRNADLASIQPCSGSMIKSSVQSLIQMCTVQLLVVIVFHMYMHEVPNTKKCQVIWH